MASISHDRNGLKRILVMIGGKRCAIRLGRVSMRHATSVRAHIEEILAARALNRQPADETIRWCDGLPDDLAAKLAKYGLIQPRGSTTLGGWLDAYIASRVDVGTGTATNYGQAKRYLLGFFDKGRPLRSITVGDAEDFRTHLQKMGLADNTIRRAIGRARQFVSAAQRRGLVASNPFDGLPAAVRANTSRFFFVTREMADQVLAECRDAEWRLIFLLARYGGLRTPSETLILKWGDVDWERGRITVHAPKTDSTRIIPMFPELVEDLRAVYDAAPEGSEYVITRYRSGAANLRTRLGKTLKRAGLKPWPKLFQNLRSTRETELAESYPIHVVCKWIGNSEQVARRHYLQLTDEHFDRATGGAESGAPAAQKAAQRVATGSGEKRQTRRAGSQKQGK